MNDVVKVHEVVLVSSLECIQEGVQSIPGEDLTPWQVHQVEMMIQSITHHLSITSGQALPVLLQSSHIISVVSSRVWSCCGEPVGSTPHLVHNTQHLHTIFQLEITEKRQPMILLV